MPRCQNVFLSPLPGRSGYILCRIGKDGGFIRSDCSFRHLPRINLAKGRAMCDRYPLVKQKQNHVCVGVHRVTDLEQFPVRISKDEASFDCYLSGRCERRTTTLWSAALRIPRPHIRRGIFVGDRLMVKTRLIRHSPQWSVCDVRDLCHGSRAYFEIKTSRQNSVGGSAVCISSFVNILTFMALKFY